MQVAFAAAALACYPAAMGSERTHGRPPHRRQPHEVPAPTLSRDTHPSAEAKQIEILRNMPPSRKWQLIDEAIKTSYALAQAGLRHRHPEADEEEIQRRLFDLLLGEELAERVYGPAPYATSSGTPRREP